MLKKKLMSRAIFVLAALAMPIVAFAAEEEGELFESLSPILDIISFIFVIIAIVIVFKLVRAYGDSVIGASLVYFLVGTFFIGSIRLFFFLNESGAISVEEMTAGIVWHVFHWISLAMYFVAGKMLIGFVDSQSRGMQTKPSYYNATVLGVFSVIFVVAVILTTTLFNDLLDQFEGTFLDRIGLIHFISFAFGGVVAFYLFKVKNRLLPAIAVIATPLIINVFLLSVSHFWELLTESWKVISLPGEIIERTEQFIMFPGFILIVYAFWRSRNLLKKAIQ